MSGPAAAVILLVLGVLGTANALYFALLYYRVLDPHENRMPQFCRLDDNACGSVVFSPFGRVFGIPNSLPGLALYLFLISIALDRMLSGKFHFLPEALAACVVSVILGIYLVYALLVRMRTPCPL